MGKFNLTPDQVAQVERENSLILPLPGSTGSESGTFHNPVTGQEIVNQPIDAYHLTRRLRQGWQMGQASPELKEKWVIREAELQEEDDQRVAKYLASEEHQASLDDQAQGFNDAVASAVAQVLEKLGVELPKTADAPTETETKQQVSEASRPKLHLVD
jgi:hypothetical protein